jgi:hypothetical protein
VSTPRNYARKYPTLGARILSKLIMAACKVPRLKGQCWQYIGHCNRQGYGRITIWDKDKKAHRSQWVHRLAFVLFGGKEIPEGMTLDHLCFNEGCCNPDHMEVCSRAENTRRMREHQLWINAGIIASKSVRDVHDMSRARNRDADHIV